MKKSLRFHWNIQDTKAFLWQAVKVLAPYLIVILPVLIGQIPKDWAWAAVTLYVLQRIQSALVLFIQGK